MALPDAHRNLYVAVILHRHKETHVMDSLPPLCKPLFVPAACSPMPERLIDLIADLLLNAEELIGLLEHEEAPPGLRAIRARAAHIYEEVNDMMKSICD
jgi:hypothetical protein